MAKKTTTHHDHPEVEINVTVIDDDCEPAPTPGGGDPTPQAPSPEQVDAAAQAFYSAMSAALSNRYPRTRAAGDPIESWAQITPAEQDGFKNGAFAILTMPSGDIEEPPP